MYRIIIFYFYYYIIRQFNMPYAYHITSCNHSTTTTKNTEQLGTQNDMMSHEPPPSQITFHIQNIIRQLFGSRQKNYFACALLAVFPIAASLRLYSISLFFYKSFFVCVVSVCVKIVQNGSDRTKGGQK